MKKLLLILGLSLGLSGCLEGPDNYTPTRQETTKINKQAKDYCEEKGLTNKIEGYEDCISSEKVKLFKELKYSKGWVDYVPISKGPGKAPGYYADVTQDGEYVSQTTNGGGGYGVELSVYKYENSIWLCDHGQKSCKRN